MTAFSLDFAPVALAFAHVVVGVLVLVIAKLVRGALSPYSIDQELTARDNPAFGVAVAGYYAAVFIIYLSAAAGSALSADQGTRGAYLQIGVDAAWALGGIVAMNASRWWMDRLLVSGIRNGEEITSKRNLAAGMLEASAFVASAFILAGAIREPGGTILTAFVLFFVGQIALIAAGRIYQALAGYSVVEQVGSGNLAAGMAFGLTLVAISLLLMKAATGDFVSWGWNLGLFAADAIAGLILLLVLRWVTDLVLLPNARIAEEIARDRNVNAGLVEGVLAIGIAATIFYLF